MSRKDGGAGMQILGLLALMGLGWALFEEDPLLIGWAFVGALLFQVSSTSRRMGRRLRVRRHRGFSLPIFGRGRSRGEHAQVGGRGHSRGGYSAPSVARGPRSWTRPTPASRAGPATVR